MMTDDLYEETERVLVWSEVEYDASVHALKLPDGEEMLFFHLDVFYMSPSVMKSMLKAWDIFRTANPYPLFTMQTDETPASRRLVEKFGFEWLRELPCTDGKTRNIFVHFAPTAVGGSKKQ
jgi:hypothetical protein